MFCDLTIELARPPIKMTAGMKSPHLAGLSGDGLSSHGVTDLNGLRALFATKHDFSPLSAYRRCKLRHRAVYRLQSYIAKRPIERQYLFRIATHEPSGKNK